MDLERLEDVIADLHTVKRKLTLLEVQKKALEQEAKTILESGNLSSFTNDQGHIFTVYPTTRVSVDKTAQLAPQFLKMVPDTVKIRSYLDQNPGQELLGVSLETTESVKFTIAKDV